MSIYAAASVDPRERRDRSRMLQRVRRIWIDGFLDDSLHGAALHALGLEGRPEAVPDRWAMVVQQPNRPVRTLAPDSSIVQVFDDLDGELLILGEPGSGKTTLLLELTRGLLDRAEYDETLPMPIVFPLAPWAANRLPLADWLVDELSQRYDVPRQIGQAWVANDRIFPLLDGLDEVAAEHRAACVEAINTYREGRAKVLPGLVVTSRVAHYEALTARLRLRGAVLIQPLRAEQIDAYLASAGEQLAGVRTALQDDYTLQELAASPLLLSTMTLAYQGIPAEALRASGTIEQRRTQLFAAYIDQMFERRASAASYTREQTLHWLGWLASALAQQAQTVFYLERLQPEWLPTLRLRRWYTVVDRVGSGVAIGLGIGLAAGLAIGYQHVGMAFGLAAGLITAFLGGASAPPSSQTQDLWLIVRRGVLSCLVVWLGVGLIDGLVVELDLGLDVWLSHGLSAALSDMQSFGLAAGPTLGLDVWLHHAVSAALGDELTPVLVVGLVGGLSYVLVLGLAGGLVGTLAGGPAIRPRGITVVETLRWSGSRAQSSTLVGLASGLVVGLGAEQFVGQFKWMGLALGGGPTMWLIYDIGLALLGGLTFGLAGGLTADELEAKVAPNQGIRRSARTATVVGVAGGLTLGLATSLVFGLAGVLVLGPDVWLSEGLSSVLNFGPDSLQSQGLSSVVRYALIFGLALGLPFGGYACLSHGALRLVLWRVGALPLGTTRFLDYATERVFLRRAGGGYIFVHRLLQDYFAGLENDTEGQTPTNPTSAAGNLARLQKRARRPRSVRLETETILLKAEESHPIDAGGVICAVCD